jgi:hypothetical protein
MMMDRFLILRRFQGVLQGTNRTFTLVGDHGTRLLSRPCRTGSIS